MNDKVEGFVLSIKDYHDNDVMMQVLTKDYGILSLVGKGAKKMTAKHHFFTMCVYEFIIDYKDHKTIYTVHGSKLLENFICEDFKIMSFNNIFLEVVLKNKELLPNDIYENLLFVFRKMNEEDMYVLGCMFFAYLIKEQGLTPIVDHCALCEEMKVVAISNTHGGFLCQRHLGQEEVQEVIRLKKFRLIIKGTFEHFEILRKQAYDLKDLNLIEKFFADNTGIILRSFEFFKSF